MSNFIIFYIEFSFFVINFNKSRTILSSRGPFFELKESLDKAYQDLNFCIFFFIFNTTMFALKDFIIR